MALKYLDDRQIIQRAALLTSIGTAANTTLDALFTQLDSVMVNIGGNQTISGIKTFSAAGTALIVNNNALVSGTLTVANSVSPIQISGDPTNAVQVLLGTGAHTNSSVGAERSSGNVFLAFNAQYASQADSWQQNAAGSASTLLDVGLNGLSIYEAAASSATATKATFWGNTVFTVGPQFAVLGTGSSTNAISFEAKNSANQIYVGVNDNGNSFFGAIGANVGAVYTNNLAIVLAPAGAKALTLDSSQNATFVGTVSMNGSTSGTFTQKANATTTNYTVSWPATQSVGTTVLQNDGTGNLSWTSATAPTSSYQISNLGLMVTTTGALTFAIKQSDHSTDPTVSSPSQIAFRTINNPSAAEYDAGYVIRNVTSATSLTLSGTSTLGLGSSVSFFPYIWVYALDNSGTVELAISASLFDEGSLQSTTALTGSDNSLTTLYSNTSRSNVSIRLIGRVQVAHTVSWGAVEETSLGSALTKDIKVYAVYVPSTNTSVPGNGSQTTVTFDTKILDSHNAMVSGTYHIPLTGVYQIDFVGQWVLSSGTITQPNNIATNILLNSSNVAQQNYTINTGNQQTSSITTYIAQLTTGALLTFGAVNNTGATFNVIGDGTYNDKSHLIIKKID